MSSAQGRKPVTFDRHLVLEQLGGWRGMVDVSLPTIAFVVANAVGGLTTGIWAALVAAVLVFGLRLARRESVQQAISGLIGVAIAVAIARASGEARDFFVLGLVRNAALGVVLLGSVVVRWPLVGVAAEFLAPSHLGSMADHSMKGKLAGRLRARGAAVVEAAEKAAERPDGAQADATPAEREPDAAPDRHWRDDRRVLRAYTWLTVLWAGPSWSASPSRASCTGRTRSPCWAPRRSCSGCRSPARPWSSRCGWWPACTATAPPTARPACRTALPAAPPRRRRA